MGTDPELGLVQLLDRYYRSPEYHADRLEARFKTAVESDVFAKLALGFMKKLEQTLVFSGERPYPVHEEHMRPGEQVIITDPDHRWYDHTVTFYGWDGNDHPLVGMRRGDAIPLYGGWTMVRGEGIHEIIVDSLISFMHFMKYMPEQIVRSNPFLPIEKDPEIDDLVYVKRGPIRERLCRVEAEDQGMYSLLTLHRSVDKIQEMVIDGFHVVAPAGGYDQEFFQKPFLTLDQIRGIVQPIAQDYFSSDESLVLMQSHRDHYTTLVSTMIAQGKPLESMVAYVAEKNGDPAMLIDAFDGSIFQFLEGFRQELLPYIELFQEYEAAGRDLVSRTAALMGVKEADLFTIDSRIPFFPGARVYVKENTRKRGHINWDYRPVVGEQDIVDEHILEYLDDFSDLQNVPVTFPLYFQENGAHISQRGDYSFNDLQLLSREDYLRFTEPEDLVRLVRLLEFQIQSHGKGDEVDLKELVRGVTEDHPVIDHENLVNYETTPSEFGYDHSAFRNPLIGHPEIFHEALPQELKHLGFNYRDIKLVFDYYFPDNEWVQLQVNHGVSMIHSVYELSRVAETVPDLRKAMELMARGSEVFEAGMKLHENPAIDHDLISILINSGSRISLPGGGPMKTVLNNIYGEGEYDTQRLAGYLGQGLLGSGSGPETSYPGSVENRIIRGSRAIVYNGGVTLDECCLNILRHMAEQEGKDVTTGTETGVGQSYSSERYGKVTYKGDGMITSSDDELLLVQEVPLASKEKIRRSPVMKSKGLGFGDNPLRMLLEMKLSELYEPLAQLDVEMAADNPIQYHDAEEGKSGFTITPLSYDIGDLHSLLISVVDTLNERNAERRQQLTSRLLTARAAPKGLID
ncbi:MAG: hypothetical protein ABIC95_00130 [archaeon]